MEMDFINHVKHILKGIARWEVRGVQRSQFTILTIFFEETPGVKPGEGRGGVMQHRLINHENRRGIKIGLCGLRWVTTAAFAI